MRYCVVQVDATPAAWDALLDTPNRVTAARDLVNQALFGWQHSQRAIAADCLYFQSIVNLRARVELMVGGKIVEHPRNSEVWGWALAILTPGEFAEYEANRPDNVELWLVQTLGLLSGPRRELWLEHMQ